MPYYTVVATNTNDQDRVRKFTGIRVQRELSRCRSLEAVDAVAQVRDQYKLDRRWHLYAVETKRRNHNKRIERWLEKHDAHYRRTARRSIWSIAAAVYHGRYKSLNKKILANGDELDYQILCRRAVDFTDKRVDKNLEELQRRSSIHRLESLDNPKLTPF